jgi:hypothetical protein
MEKQEFMQRLAMCEGDEGGLRVAIALPDGAIISGPLVGVSDVQEDGETVTIIVASAFRHVVL